MFSYNINFVKKPFITGLEYKIDFKSGTATPENHYIEYKCGILNKKTTYGVGIDFIKSEEVKIIPSLYIGYNF